MFSTISTLYGEVKKSTVVKLLKLLIVLNSEQDALIFQGPLIFNTQTQHDVIFVNIIQYVPDDVG